MITIAVFVDALGVVALRAGNEAMLKRPSENDLGRGSVVLFGQLQNPGVIQDFASGKRAIRLNQDVFVSAVLDDVALLAPRMEL